MLQAVAVLAVEDALTNLKGYTWYSNGKSRFSGQYETALVKNKK